MERDPTFTVIGYAVDISTHALTWSATTWSMLSKTRLKFQLTRSRGARQAYGRDVGNAISISTHALTWSATIAGSRKGVIKNISTHALTWSATKFSTDDSVTGEFQLTRSRGARLYSGPTIFNPAGFQLTRSRGARRAKRTALKRTRHFNSRAHVERDCCSVCYP